MIYAINFLLFFASNLLSYILFKSLDMLQKNNFKSTLNISDSMKFGCRKKEYISDINCTRNIAALARLYEEKAIQINFNKNIILFPLIYTIPLL